MNESRELIPLDNPNPAILFAPGGLSELLDKIEQDARALVPNLTTAKGRKEIASNASRVARAKVYLDEIGKEFVGRLKKQTMAIDAERKSMRDRLDALKDEVRRPLTEWEDAEKKRVEDIKQKITWFDEQSRSISGCNNPRFIESVIANISGALIDENEFQEFTNDAKSAKKSVLGRLEAVLQSAIAHEELARIQAERDAEIAAREAAEQAERQEREMKEREARAAKDAEERTKRQAEEAMEAERRKQESMRIDAERRAAIAEQQARDATERERKRAENERLRIESERQARERDEANKMRVRDEIYSDILDDVILEGIAESITDAIINGRIRNVRVDY